MDQREVISGRQEVRRGGSARDTEAAAVAIEKRTGDGTTRDHRVSTNRETVIFMQEVKPKKQRCNLKQVLA